MRKKDLQCLFVGEKSELYSDLIKALDEFDLNLQVKFVDVNKNRVLQALKRLKGAGLVFVSDDVKFSYEVLSDLVWQYAPDALVIILSSESESVKLDRYFDNAQFSRLKFKKNSNQTSLFLQELLQKAQLKSDFRQCKHLLGISEKRCQWLVDSSREAVAYITRDMHLYANNAYLGVLQIHSVEELRTIPVKDVVDENEYVLFERYIENQLKHFDINRSLVLSLKKNNGELFRANLRVIPSVYKGKKCLQLWVSVVDKFPKNADSQAYSALNIKSSEKVVTQKVPKEEKTLLTGKVSPNPFSALIKKKDSKEQEKTSKEEQPILTQSSVIQEILKRKDVSLIAQKLTLINAFDQVKPHHLLSLKVDHERKANIEDLLFEHDAADLKEIFWDKVKFTLLTNSLAKKLSLDVDLLIRVSPASLANKEFRLWLESEIASLGGVALHLVFILPPVTNKKQMQAVFGLIQSLKFHRCKIAMGDFTVSRKSLKLMKMIAPEYIFLSQKWLEEIKGHNKKEATLARYIRKIESTGIRVVASCFSDKVMKQLFVLSGVSFCLKKR